MLYAIAIYCTVHISLLSHTSPYLVTHIPAYPYISLHIYTSSCLSTRIPAYQHVLLINTYSCLSTFLLINMCSCLANVFLLSHMCSFLLSHTSSCLSTRIPA